MFTPSNVNVSRIDDSKGLQQSIVNLVAAWTMVTSTAKNVSVSVSLVRLLIVTTLSRYSCHDPTPARCTERLSLHPWSSVAILTSHTQHTRDFNLMSHLLDLYLSFSMGIYENNIFHEHNDPRREQSPTELKPYPRCRDRSWAQRQGLARE